MNDVREGNTPQLAASRCGRVVRKSVSGSGACYGEEGPERSCSHADLVDLLLLVACSCSLEVRETTGSLSRCVSGVSVTLLFIFSLFPLLFIFLAWSSAPSGRWRPRRRPASHMAREHGPESIKLGTICLFFRESV